MIRLSIRGQGHCPSFKNSKVLARGRMFTKPEYQEWMEKAILAMAYQLRSIAQTSATGTLTEPQLRSWIASSLPLDDSRHWIPKLTVEAVDCEKGMEGADIVIEILSERK